MEENQETQKLFCCSTCDNEFTSKNELMKHERTHTGNDMQQGRPQICSFYLKNRCVYGSRGKNENGECQFEHPRRCIYIETRGCKKGDECDFFHAKNIGNGDSSSHHSAAHRVKRDSYKDGTNQGEKGLFHKSGHQNGNNRRTHSNALPVTRHSNQSSQGSSLDMAFLGKTMLKALQEHLEKIGQDNNNNLGAKKWPGSRN